MNKLKTAIFSASIVLSISVSAQDKKVKAMAWDGFAIVGYVDKGGFINFGGPCCKVVAKTKKKPLIFTLGMLPSLRIKEDKVAIGAKKNSLVTPTLGLGLTMAYRHLAVQLPFFYNSKNTTANGQWNIGTGIGYKF